MNRTGFFKFTSYLFAVVICVLGVLIIAGIIRLNVETSARYAFGFILILMGIYRFAMTLIKQNTLKKRKYNFHEDE